MAQFNSSSVRSDSFATSDSEPTKVGWLGISLEALEELTPWKTNVGHGFNIRITQHLEIAPIEVGPSCNVQHENAHRSSANEKICASEA